jgi:hypothetical protein
MADWLNVSALQSGFFLPAATSPPPEVPIGMVPATLGVVQGTGAVEFTLNGVARWLIDVSRFAGTPSLTLVPGQGEVQSRLTLEGARLPGTDVPADFVVVIGKTGPLGTSADFTFTFGGFHGQVILENWLAGSAVLQSPVTLNGEICALGASSNLAFTASGEARFAPDWQMEIAGTDIATISGLGSPIPSNQLTLQLLAPTDPSISQHPEPKRTLLKMPAGAHSWTLTPEVTSLPIGTLSAAPGLFAAVAIEAGEAPAGETARELLASSSKATGLTLAVAGGFTDQDGHPFMLSLASPSYAIAFDTSANHSAGDQTVVTAGFSTPGWLVVDGFALQLGDSPAGFEYDAVNQSVTSLRCEPALIAAAAPLSSASGDGVAAEPLGLTGVTIPFVTTPGAAPGWGIVAGPEVTGQRRFSLPDFGVSVLRRDDLLALNFQFFNLALEGGGGNPPLLLPKTSSEPAFLVAQFNSPQNIAEQAYLEDYTDPDPTKNLLAETPDPPGAVQTRAAGPSRLAFQLPSGTTVLPYSLNSLLNWVALQQSVVDVAAVPDSNQAGPNPEVDNDLTVLAGAVAPAAGSALVGFWGSDASVHVNFVGADGHVHELYIAPGRNWVDNDLTGLAGAVAPAAGSALVGFWGSDASVHVNFIGTDGHIHELYIAPNRSWVDNDLTGLAGAVAPAASTPLNGFWSTQNSQHINFIGTDGHVHELFIAPGPNRIDNDLTALAGAVAPGVTTALVGFWGTDGSAHVNFIGADNHVHDLYIAPGAGWIVPEPQAPAQTPQIQQPAATETAIEAPWRLFLSPNYSGTWAHSAAPVTLSNRTELWHTRLAVRTLQGDGLTADETIPPRVRAVWSPDYIKPPGAIPDHPLPPFGTDAAPFRMSLDPNDRDQIVRLSSDFTMSVPAGEAYVPISIPADTLYLSTLGAWIEVFGSWPDPLPVSGNAVFSVEQWQHRAALGRDNYVRVVSAGFLLPFGNDASLVKVTERKLQSINDGSTTAYLRQRFFIIVRQPTVAYSGLTDAQQRNLPYRSVTLTTLVTPDVVPQVVAAPDGSEHYAFFPTTGPNSFLFHIVGTDWEGNTSEFTAPLYFVERGGDFTKAVQAYNSSGAGTALALSGQKIAFAPHNNPGDTSLHTTDLTFTAQPAQSPWPDPDANSPFFPSMDAANVVVPAIQQMSGGSGAMSIQYFSDYLNDGMGIGEVFAQNAGGQLTVGFNGKQSGGVAVPDLTVSGLSRKFGTVSGTNPIKINQGTFDATDIFQNFNATLFGVVKLADLLDTAVGALGGLTNPNQAPILTTKRLPDQITTTLSFTPLVKQTYSALGGFITMAFSDPSHALALNATIVTALTGGDPQVSIHGELNNFTLSLAKVVGITINQIAFDAPAGQKLSVSASMPPTDDNGPIQFLGDLSFLNELRSLIPSDGFSDPPSLDVSSEGITAGFSLPIPSVGVGVFSLENINLSAALTLPFFTPSPIRFRFAFCEREHPFTITVSMLGGGGFFGITVGPDGVEILEASIEVGADVSIDVVVASGNVHIMAGVYLKYDMVSSSSQLTGYLRAGGSLDVLGLISASVEFYLGFTYFFGPPCSIAGEATITIEVHVLFFSASVSATLRREFGDPPISFAQLIGPTDWDNYCDAFAA